MEKLNVAIVDDNPLILNTLDELINAEDGLSVIGKADNGADAINMIVDTTPDIVLLDLCRLPRYLTKPRQRRSEWDMAGSDGISRVSTVFRGKSLLTNKMRII